MLISIIFSFQGKPWLCIHFEVFPEEEKNTSPQNMPFWQIHMVGLFHAFRETGEGPSVLVQAISQEASIQNNQYALVVCSG